MIETQDPQFDLLLELIHADSELKARAVLQRSLNAHDCVTSALIIFGDSDQASDLSPVWFDTRNLSGGQPPDMDFGDVLTRAKTIVPHRIAQWIMNKVGPVRLSRIGIFIPQLVDFIKQGEARYGLPPAEEIILYPVYGAGRQFSFFFVFTSEVDKFILHEIGSITYAYFSAWKGYLSQYREEASPLQNHVKLSPEELEVLRWLVAGKTLDETAAITGRSYQSVRYHADKVRKRYGYATLQQTIVRAALDYGFDPLGK